MQQTLRLNESELGLLELIMEKTECKTKNGAIRMMIKEYLDKEREISDLKWKVKEMGAQVNIFAKKQANFLSALEDLKSF